MKRAWIIPAVICLLLLVAWPLRWEKGPTQSVSGQKIKIIHLQDRWTGQAWIDLYGFVDEKLVSGEMRPVHSQADIAKRKKQILARSKEAQKRQELEKKLTEYKEIKKLNSTAYAKYNELVEKNYQEIDKELKEESDEEKEKIERLGLSRLERQVQRLGPATLDVLDLEERYFECEDGIPQEIINGRVAYFNADQEEKKISGEINNQQKQAETTAMSELVSLAWRKRNIATGLWVGFLVLSAAIAGILFIRNSRNQYG
jgi:hypothetical protein